MSVLVVGSAATKRDWSRVAIAGGSDVLGASGSSGGREVRSGWWFDPTVMVVVVVVLLLRWRCLLLLFKWQ